MVVTMRNRRCRSHEPSKLKGRIVTCSLCGIQFAEHLTVSVGRFHNVCEFCGKDILDNYNRSILKGEQP